ncbi:DUF397 domain-containing protein [Streptomyces griseomycini]|uniref:DUF397 domain-containing protein n=1 Tax=Streptomyces griseomycini TaxID=66895 RepID=A0A7W7PNI8_9ACTN|nr:DUF397 domain-containing protein [Streptomyces griseomycini]MBB4896462.1 hypothetical protein [Streptomyces griseomycini]GGP84493.1 DUF397 domain-containing protein [Streptomyces griseomycini]GGR02208.1 DUF397 domain-containing protein [Streptomyces griseomycini]
MNRKGSGGNDTDLIWFRSSYSDSSNPNDCVEVALAPGAVRVRDSKAPDGPLLTVTPAAWSRFVTGAGGAVAP